MYCNQCGSELKEGAVFCTKCGAKQEPQIQEETQVENLDKTVGIYGIETENSVSEQAQQPVKVQNPITTPSREHSVQTFGSQHPVNNAQTVNYGSPNPNYNDTIMQMGAPHIGVSFGEAIKLFFKNYVNFTGRSSRSEYWFAFLFNVLISIPETIISSYIPPLGGLISLGLMIPGIAAFVRRMHDIGKPWYRMFIGLIPIAGVIILIVDLCKESDRDNKWGYGPFHN